MRKAVLSLAVIIGLASSAHAQSGDAISLFNTAMQAVPQDGSPSARLEASVEVLRRSMAATDVIGSIVGEHRALFSDEQLSRLARALLYKMAADMLIASGGPVRLEETGRRNNNGRRSSHSVVVIPRSDALTPVQAVVVTGIDQQGADRIFDVIIDGKSIVEDETRELAATINAVAGNPELSVQVVEDVVNGLLSGL